MFKIELSNYRFIRNHTPITFNIDGGVTFILGLNNTGKSALLRSIHELQWLWRNIPGATAVYTDKLNRGKVASINGLFSNKFDCTSDGLHWDEFVNRKGARLPVKIKIKAQESSLNISISPKGNEQHTNQFSILIETTSPPNDHPALEYIK